MTRLALFAGLVVTAAAVSGFGLIARAKPAAVPGWMAPLATALCRHDNPNLNLVATELRKHTLKPAPLKVVQNTPGIFVVQGTLDANTRLRVQVLRAGTTRRLAQLTTHLSLANSSRETLVRTNADCRVVVARTVVRDGRGLPDKLLHYDNGFAAPSRIELLNPPVPAGADPGGVAVAHIDTGIAYTLPVFARRLARDSAGRILGQDFADNDHRPFDLDPSTPPLFPRRHGSAVASIILREAPKARLIPYRYSTSDFSTFADIVEAVARGPARIVALSLGGYATRQWTAFADAMRAHREILFVVSAGNEGRDISAQPVYPAAFALDNMLVVTSSDAFGRLPMESNWSATLVDVSTPGEGIAVIDHRGARGKASGSSYAVPRIAALAARLSARHPDWNAARIKTAILSAAGPLPGRTVQRTRHGWIANPAIE